MASPSIICFALRRSFLCYMKFGSAAKESLTRTSEKNVLLPMNRHSSGFEQFSAVLQGSENLSILDMSGASQANVSFITSFGHRIFTDDILATMEQCFAGDFLEIKKSQAKLSASWTRLSRSRINRSMVRWSGIPFSFLFRRCWIRWWPNSSESCAQAGSC